MGPERLIEAHLSRRVRAAGGWSLKIAPIVAGTPDRLVLLPGGRVYLVELKAPRGRLRPAQVVWHRRAARMGHPVVVLASKAAVDRWLDAELSPML